MSEYYNASSDPADNSDGEPAVLRTEHAAIAAGFAKLPVLSGNGNKVVVVNSGGTALTVAAGALIDLGVNTWTGVQTFSAQPIFSTLTASRAVFTDGSKGLVSNAITGSGNVVMSASPTFTGTAVFAAMTATTLVATTVTAALVGNATTATDTASKTGTGSVYATNTSPVFVTPTLGAASASTLTISGSTLAFSSASQGTVVATGANASLVLQSNKTAANAGAGISIQTYTALDAAQNLMQFISGQTVSATSLLTQVSGGLTSSGRIHSTLYTRPSNVAKGNSGTAMTITFADGNCQSVTMNNPCTFTYVFPAAGTYKLKVTMDATGSRVPTHVGLTSSAWRNSTGMVPNPAANSVSELVIDHDGTTTTQQWDWINAVPT